jgi:hypothetical protein
VRLTGDSLKLYCFAVGEFCRPLATGTFYTLSEFSVGSPSGIEVALDSSSLKGWLLPSRLRLEESSRSRLQLML